MPAGAPIGNKNAAKCRLFTDELRKVLTQEPDKLRQLVATTLDAAIKGDASARSQLLDRLEGKAIQVIAGDEDQPLTFSLIERVIIDKAGAAKD